MPRRRRKYRPPQSEQEKPMPFFAKSHAEEPEAALMQAGKKQLPNNDPIKVAREGALQLLKTVRAAIKNSQPEGAHLSQSKALEWYNQFLEADVSDITIIQQAIARFCTTVKDSHFTCGLSIDRPYGKEAQRIDLGYSFKELGMEEQVLALLKASIQHSHLPERHKLPAGQHEHIDPVAAWAKYLVTLLQLLPERPYLITGTPTSTSTFLDETGEGGEEPQPMNFFNRLFGSTNKAESEEVSSSPPLDEKPVSPGAVGEIESEGGDEQAIGQPLGGMGVPEDIPPAEKTEEDESKDIKGRGLWGRLRGWFSRKK